MNFIKSLFTLILVFALAISCKSEKKEAATEEGTSIEQTEDAPAEATQEEAAPSEAEATEPEAESEGEETEEAEEEKKITVVFPKDTKLAEEVKEALKEFAKDNPEMTDHFNNVYAFAIYPKITKGGLGVGGAGGKGLVFDDKTVIGESKLAQATFGLQAGGQQYMEAIFFEDQAALNRFTAGKVKFSGQASAVALKAGVSADMKYQDGVAIVTKAIGGLMAEASVGGQSFKYEPGIN